METVGRIGLSLLVGYLLGSLSPAWALGRLLKGIDIRTVGYRNAGARNARTVLRRVAARQEQRRSDDAAVQRHWRRQAGALPVTR